MINSNHLEKRLEQIEKLLIESLFQKQKSTDHYLNIVEAADLLCKSIHTVYGLVSRREIPHLKKGNRLYFRENDLRDWLEAGSRKTIDELVLQSQTGSLLNLNPKNNE